MISSIIIEKNILLRGYMRINTSSMWLRKERNYTGITLDKLLFDSKRVYLKIHPISAHLENIQLIDQRFNEKTNQLIKEPYKDNYKIKGGEYFSVDNQCYGEYDTIILPVCFVKADVIFDDHKGHRYPANGTINGIIKPALDENNELKDAPPEFHFYFSTEQQTIVGHSVNYDNGTDGKTLMVNMAAIDQTTIIRDQTIVSRFKHMYQKQNKTIVPPWFEIKTYHGDIRRENFSKGVFVTRLEQ
jgi:hypothetical protein